MTHEMVRELEILFSFPHDTTDDAFVLLVEPLLYNCFRASLKAHTYISATIPAELRLRATLQEMQKYGSYWKVVLNMPPSFTMK